MKTLLALSFGFTFIACGGSVDVPAEASGSATGAGGASTTVGTTSTSTGSSVGGASTTSGSPTSSTTDGPGGGPASCGGLKGLTCSPGEFCLFPNHNCGGADDEGVCTPKPLDCDVEPSMPVCACDDMTYGNACLANIAGWDVSTLGSCMIPAGTFPCGVGFCKTGVEYCAGNLQEPGKVCTPLPASCLPPNAGDCSCLKSVGCGSCTGNPGELTAICGEG